MKLYVVATPIGNLSDFTLRAKEILQKVDLIAAEDTRHSRILLQHYGISTPMTAYHDFSDANTTEQIIGKLRAGQSIALISDAGTPLISDPGYRLVHDVIDAGFEVIPVPGASALLAALSVSGLPTDRFLFEGFLPAKTAGRRERLEKVRHETATLVWYESPHRVVAMIEDVREVLGDDRPLVIARELTKTFEQVSRDTARQIATLLQDGSIPIKGEFVVMAAGNPEPGAQFEADHLLRVLLADLPPARAASVASQLLKLPRKQLYQLAMKLKKPE